MATTTSTQEYVQKPAKKVGQRTFLGMNAQAWRRQRNGMLFVAPWVIGFLAFTLTPMVSSLYYSFTSYNAIKPARWVGLQNYVLIFTADPYIRVAVVNTLYLAFFNVVLGTILALALALLLNRRVRGIGVYRTLYYLPTMLPIIVSAFIFLLVLDPQEGIVNNVLSVFGIQGPGWLNSPYWSKPALIILGLWGVGNSMVIYLAGLQDVPKNLMEAAATDGANWWQRLVNVTLPALSPVIFFNVVLAVINALQNFLSIFFLTSNSTGGAGGPANSTLTWGLLIYNNAFFNSRMGYASAMSWLMFLVVLSLTLILFRLGAFAVYYEGGEA
jgi:multiple sugar transport system permease protein